MSDEELRPDPAAPSPVADQPVADHEQAQAVELDDAARRAPIHEGDRVPRFLLRTQAWIHERLSSRTRVAVSILVILLVIFVALRLTGLKILGIAFGIIDPFFMMFGLFLVNWMGNGGVLVPIPGARFVGLLLIFQNAVLLPSWEVWLVSGAAMALGLLSYYLAGARTAQSYADGDAAGAERLAADTGMLDDETDDFAPGAELDTQAAMALAGVNTDPQAAADAAQASGGSATHMGRLRLRLATSLKRTQERAQPVIERRGANGMFLLCFAPTPMGTAAAYLGGLMRFGFSRYLLASFTAKFLLAGIIVVLALVFSETARAVQIPEIELPIINVTLFDDGLPALPGASASPTPSGVPLD